MIKVKYHPLKPKIDSHRKIHLKSRTSCVRVRVYESNEAIVVINPRRKRRERISTRKIRSNDSWLVCVCFILNTDDAYLYRFFCLTYC